MIREHILTLVYFLAGVGAAFAANLAFGQEGVRDRITIMEPGAPGCFADVLIVDRVGVYNEDVVLETSLGPVVVRYETRTDHADPDFAEVLAQPPNVVAHPPYLDLAPSETSVICLIEWQGM